MKTFLFVLRRTSHLAPATLWRPSSRSAASVAAAKNFTAFFSHNDTWARPLADSAHRALPIAPPPPPSPPSRAFRHAEVLTPRRLLNVYAQLSKSRLTALIVLTAMSGVALSPLPTTVPVLLATAAGTALCSASANSLNQLQEVPYDAQMPRTRSRPLVRRAISPLHASAFAALTAIAGPALLAAVVNPTTAFLGAANIALYAGAYTSLKRKGVSNTWVGALVGGVPPLMGWTACGGHLLPSPSYPVHLFLPSFLDPAPIHLHLIDNPLAPCALFLLLFSWQFPHFNSLSHLVRDSYAQAGYRMLSVLDPPKNALVALRHALLLVPVCSVLVPLSGLTSWSFALVALVPNLVCTRAAWKFWRSGSEKDARTLWYHSLWYLPVVLGLMMACKRGLDWGSWIRMGKEQDEKSAAAIDSEQSSS